MDSLVHALESYAAPKANALSRIFSIYAAWYVYNALPKVAKKLDDVKARLDLQLGAYLAGIAIVQAGGGPASILSYPLGVYGKVPHGIAGAVFLPYVIEHNVKKGYDYSELYSYLAGAKPLRSKTEKSRTFTKKMFDLHKAMGIPQLFSLYPLAKEQAPAILKEIEGLQGGFNATNPVPFSVKDAQLIFSKILNPKS